MNIRHLNYRRWLRHALQLIEGNSFIRLKVIENLNQMAHSFDPITFRQHAHTQAIDLYNHVVTAFSSHVFTFPK